MQLLYIFDPFSAQNRLETSDPFVNTHNMKYRYLFIQPSELSVFIQLLAWGTNVPSIVPS